MGLFPNGFSLSLVSGFSCYSDPVIHLLSTKTVLTFVFACVRTSVPFWLEVTLEWSALSLVFVEVLRCRFDIRMLPGGSEWKCFFEE